ncbi:MAG: universal stress protein [Deltaproteobacteria bacterium]|nr:MAG: universal stress protein [Deltaproteobacteria bacterium]
MVAKQIVVPLTRHDRIEEIIPYLEEIAKPGMRVVFLVPYGVELWAYLRDHWITMESPTLAGKKIKEQKGSAEHGILAARDAFRSMGVEITVEVYTGSLKRVIRNYTTNGDMHLIIMRAAGVARLMRFFMGCSFRQPGLPPVLFSIQVT